MAILKALDAQQREYLVFGLTWQVVIGQHPERQAQAQIRAARATHYVVPGAHAFVVGYGQLGAVEPGSVEIEGRARPGWMERIGRRLERKAHPALALYSAAQLFADRHPHGVNAYLGEIDDRQFWLVATQEGAVIPGCDEVFDTHEEGRAALAELRQEYPQAVVAHEIHLEPVTPTAALRRRQHPLQALPLSVRLSVGAALIALMVGQGADLWSVVREATRGSHPVASAVDANALWRDQLDRWQQGVALDGPEGLQALLTGIGQIPMRLAGWPLLSVHCEPTAVGWQCRALYKRGAQGGSTNAAFSAALPAGWRVRWVDLDQGKTERAQVEWQLPAHRTPLDRAQLPQAASIERDYVSRVQAVSAAFKVAVVPKVLPPPEVPVPTYQDGEGQTVAVPVQDVTEPQARIPGLRGVQVEGPLRSMTVLPLPLASVIQRIDFTVADGREPSLANSLLTAAVTGVFYVQ